MWVNLSSISDDLCFTSQVRFLINISFCGMKTIVLLPLCIFVLHLCFQRQRQQLPLKTMSHSDIFTFHLAAMELLWVLGFICHLCGTLLINTAAVMLGFYSYSVVFYGEMFFHILTCVDWYLAVVHPIVYVQLRSTRGVRIRNICITSVWLLCLGLSCLQVNLTSQSASVTMCCLAVSIVVVTFCSLSALYALICPGPGEGGVEKERVDQLKRRAFYTITAISSMLWLWFVAFFVGTALAESPVGALEVKCVMLASFGWFNLPTSLTSPLLFLHKAGKLSSICSKKE